MTDHNDTQETNTMPTPPNAHRRLLAEIFADAEDHHLGTWAPAFQPHPDKTEQACAFVATRTDLLAGKRLSPTTTLPELADADDAELLALHYAVQAATAELLIPGASLTHEQIGLDAWSRLTIDECRNSLGTLLGVYVGRVLDEERERAGEKIADRPDVETCLEEFDESMAWDAVVDHSAAAPDEHEAVVDRDVLQRLLDELALLRRRPNPAPASDAA